MDKSEIALQLTLKLMERIQDLKFEDAEKVVSLYETILDKLPPDPDPSLDGLAESIREGRLRHRDRTREPE